MPIHDVLTPQEAAYIATNCYFTLENWINNKPRAGVETTANVQDRVMGAGTAGTVKAGTTNVSLKATALGSGKLQSVVAGTSGLGTRSGFGYLLNVKKGDLRHAIIATRGTRPEMGLPDLLTDARAAMTGFGDFGRVHKGFKVTFDSVIGNLQRDHGSIMDADVVHCVGHSLGGAVATLMGAHYAGLGKKVRLYTFGSPRVGAFTSYAAMHEKIGKPNIYRVAHDLDPVSLVGLFKLFSHVLKGISTALILGLTAVDLLAEMLHNGMTKMAILGEQVFTLLRHAAKWAGITVAAGAQFTTQIISRILSMMLARLNSMATHAIHAGANHLVAMPLAIAGGFALAHSVAL